MGLEESNCDVAFACKNYLCAVDACRLKYIVIGCVRYIVISYLEILDFPFVMWHIRVKCLKINIRVRDRTLSTSNYGQECKI